METILFGIVIPIIILLLIWNINLTIRIKELEKYG